MKSIEISKRPGIFALVDDCDLELINGKKLFLMSEYVCTSINRKPVRLHRLILNPPEGLVVDHINGNPLDNRRSNLRICTTKENTRNSKKPSDGKTSTHKGVNWVPSRSRWIAKIMCDGVRISIGYFKSETDAASAYNSFAVALHGEFARLNDVIPLMAEIDVGAVLAQRATGVRRDSPFGVPGVTYNKKGQRWEVQLKGKYIGMYKTLDEAVSSRRAAEAQCNPTA